MGCHQCDDTHFGVLEPGGDRSCDDTPHAVAEKDYLLASNIIFFQNFFGKPKHLRLLPGGVEAILGCKDSIGKAFRIPLHQAVGNSPISREVPNAWDVDDGLGFGREHKAPPWLKVKVNAVFGGGDTVKELLVVNHNNYYSQASYLHPHPKPTKPCLNRSVNRLNKTRGYTPTSQ